MCLQKNTNMQNTKNRVIMTQMIERDYYAITQHDIVCLKNKSLKKMYILLTLVTLVPHYCSSKIWMA